MKLKVCGMRNAVNIDGLSKLDVDFLGLIFYEKSPRFVDEEKDPISSVLPKKIKKVGVFVNADMSFVTQKIRLYNLDYVQLHGDESLDFCKELSKQQVGIIKVFSIENELPEALTQYEPYVDYFLFDTKAPNYGGSGKQFNWDLLAGYSSNTQYFISGGIRTDDITDIVNRNLPGLYAIDINSGVELEPGLKNLQQVKLVTELIKKS